jgi:hypothetical protein
VTRIVTSDKIVTRIKQYLHLVDGVGSFFPEYKMAPDHDLSVGLRLVPFFCFCFLLISCLVMSIDNIYALIR